MIPGDIFDTLMDQVHLRAKTLPEGSYTTKLIQGGSTKMGAKILEEVLETVVAANELDAVKNRMSLEIGTIEASDKESVGLEKVGVESSHEKAREHLIYETCDVLYHLWVLVGSYGISVEELRRELARREGVSGLDEKKSRKIEGKKT